MMATTLHRTSNTGSILRKRTAIATLTLAVTALGATADASDGPRSLSTLVDEAELVIRGKVLDIQYRLSLPSGPELARVPYTFVTYKIEEVFKGADPGLTVTLRFIGGFDEEQMLYMAASHAPQFDLGDEDILFCAGNLQRLCPLVENTDGRLRIIGGQLFSETGRAVTLADDGDTIKLGERYRLDAVETTTVLGRVFTSSPGPDALNGPSREAVKANAIAQRLLAIAPAAPHRPLADADAGLDFPGPVMTAAAPPARQAGEEQLRPEVNASEITLPTKRD